MRLSTNRPDRRQAAALVVGALAFGALLLRASRRPRQRSTPATLPPALDADVHEMEMMEGQARYYKRPGTGTPVVLLHSINAAGSSFEMKPIFDHLARTTGRPLYALDWLGFGLSDRPEVRYRPGLCQRQLRRFLSEHVGEAADLVALSLGCEYAAAVADAFPTLIRKQVFVMPTALAADDEGSFVQRAAIGLLSGLGLFEIAFRRLTKKETLRAFYARQVFPEGYAVPDALVDYAYLTTQAKGASNAPRRFIEGALFTRKTARARYRRLSLPTLFLVPQDAGSKVQSFERLTEVVAASEEGLQVRRLRTGLLPHWENEDAFFEILDTFLRTDV